nr:hypothetical protein [uncultured Methylotenera sp.]
MAIHSCSKCNRWKSSHWPINKSLGISHNGKIGFVDPFIESRLNYFNVDLKGELESINGPSEYLIELLHLNRPSRVLIRRNRLLSCRVLAILDFADSSMLQATQLLGMGYPANQVAEKLNLARSAIKEIREIWKQLNSL